MKMTATTPTGNALGAAGAVSRNSRAPSLAQRWRGSSNLIPALLFLGLFFLAPLIGRTAGEAKNPQKTIPSAIGSVFWRILLFYVGALFVNSS